MDIMGSRHLCSECQEHYAKKANIRRGDFLCTKCGANACLRGDHFLDAPRSGAQMKVCSRCRCLYIPRGG